MEKKKLLILVLVLAVLMVGAVLLYDTLSDKAKGGQLAVVTETVKEAESPEETDSAAARDSAEASESSSSDTAEEEKTEDPETGDTAGAYEGDREAAESPAAEDTEGNSESVQEETAATETEVRELAPDFTAYTADGQPVRLSDFIGKPVILNFWASWCGPCKSEMPDFDELYREVGDEVQFLMVNMTDGGRETVEAASAFIAEQGYVFPVFYDTAQEAANAYYVYSIPCTYFIDAAGCPAAQATGAIDMETLRLGLSYIRP